jgi:hypothetical protein
MSSVIKKSVDDNGIVTIYPIDNIKLVFKKENQSINDWFLGLIDTVENKFNNILTTIEIMMNRIISSIEMNLGRILSQIPGLRGAGSTALSRGEVRAAEAALAAGGSEGRSGCLCLREPGPFEHGVFVQRFSGKEKKECVGEG